MKNSEEPNSTRASRPRASLTKVAIVVWLVALAVSTSLWRVQNDVCIANMCMLTYVIRGSVAGSWANGRWATVCTLFAASAVTIPALGLWPLLVAKLVATLLVLLRVLRAPEPTAFQGLAEEIRKEWRLRRNRTQIEE